MSSWPLQTRCQVSSGPLRLRSIGAQIELIVAAIGEKWRQIADLRRRSGISRFRAADRPRRRSRWVVIFHRPGSMPSARAAEAANVEGGGCNDRERTVSHSILLKSPSERTFGRKRRRR